MGEMLAPQKGDQIYDVAYFDEGGEEIRHTPTKQLHPIEDGVECELHFMTTQYAIGAAEYKVRLLRPKEVNQLVKDHKKATASQRRKELVNSLTSEIMSFYGFDGAGALSTLALMQRPPAPNNY